MPRGRAADTAGETNNSGHVHATTRYSFVTAGLALAGGRSDLVAVSLVMDSDPTKRPAWVVADTVRARTCYAILLPQCGTLALYLPPGLHTMIHT